MIRVAAKTFVVRGHRASPMGPVSLNCKLIYLGSRCHSGCGVWYRAHRARPRSANVSLCLRVTLAHVLAEFYRDRMEREQKHKLTTTLLSYVQVNVLAHNGSGPMVCQTTKLGRVTMRQCPAVSERVVEFRAG